MMPMFARVCLIPLLVFIWTLAYAEEGKPDAALLLNDVHSRLNATRVAEIVRPASVEEVVSAVRRAKACARSNAMK